MSININNYEEFLLLYVDGELDNNLCIEVENFIAQNETAKNELNVLLDTKLMPDEVSFGDTTCLMKLEKNEVSLHNYEEKFLLFVDNELTVKEKNSVEKFVLQNPTLQTAFIAIKNSKLQIENIKYPNKKELYRKEKKPIVFYLQRLAVAAVFIGLMILVWNLNGSNKKDNIVINKNAEKANIGNIKSIEKNEIITNENFTIKSEGATVLTIDKKKYFGLDKNKTTIISKATTNATNTTINNAVTKTNTPASIKINENENENNNTNTAIIANNNLPVNNNQDLNKILATQTETPNTQIAVNTFTKNNSSLTNLPVKIIYKTLDTDNDDDKTVLIANTTVSKAKVQGLINKFTKVFNKRKATDDDTEKSTFLVL